MGPEFRLVSGTGMRFQPTAQGESELRPRLIGRDCTTRYYARCGEDGNFITEFVVVNPVGEQRVFTRGPNGEEFRWGCRQDGPNRIVFYPHDAYTGGPVMYYHGPECKAEPMVPKAERDYFFGGNSNGHAA